MHRRQSLRLVPTPHHRLALFSAMECQPMATADYCHCQSAQSCRVVLTYSAVMPAVLPRARCTLRGSPASITAFRLLDGPWL